LEVGAGAGGAEPSPTNLRALAHILSPIKNPDITRLKADLQAKSDASITQKTAKAFSSEKLIPESKSKPTLFGDSTSKGKKNMGPLSVGLFDEDPEEEEEERAQIKKRIGGGQEKKNKKRIKQ